MRGTYAGFMRRPEPSDLALVATVAALTALLVVQDPAAGIAEWVFGTVVLSLAGFVIKSAVVAGRGARAERARVRQLQASRPDEIARDAIHEERRRLSSEIVVALRRTMAEVLAETQGVDAADPLPALRRIHLRTQLATSELRRHLGLLRSPVPAETRIVEGVADAGVVPRRDLALAAGLTALAVTETTWYLLVEGPQAWLPWTPVLSALAAACVAYRTAAPAAASIACAAVFVIGSLLGYPVVGGFWIFGTVGSLVWGVTARARMAARELSSGALLVGAVVWTLYVSDPENLPVVVAMMSVAAAGGLVVSMARRREARAHTSALAHEVELLTAKHEAVNAERIGFARDLHDVVSHAVGLIALQSSAAQVSWPRDPDGVFRCVAVISATARATLEELDQLGLDDCGHEPGVEDLDALVTRIRASGGSVDLTVVGDLPTTCGAVVHRVLQESLTNAVRHAPGAAVCASVSCDEHYVVVRVSDAGPGPGPYAARGYGLVGLAERVALAGGSLTTGVGPEGGFLVEAVLPASNQVVSP